MIRPAAVQPVKVMTVVGEDRAPEFDGTGEYVRVIDSLPGSAVVPSRQDVVARVPKPVGQGV